MTKMLVDGGATVYLMPYATFRKLGFVEEDLVQTNMMLTDFEGDMSPAQGAVCVDLTIGSKALHSSSSTAKVRMLYSSAGIGFMPTVAFHQQCISARSNGSDILWNWST